MTAAYLIRGDAKNLPLASGSVQCICTSPPYMNLRAYQTTPVEWADGSRYELGSEPTPALFVAHLVEVMRECWRVLRNDGCVFVNIGDSYGGSGKGPTGKTGVGKARKLVPCPECGGAPVAGSCATCDGQGQVYRPGTQETRQGFTGNGGMHRKRLEAGAIGNAWVPAPPGVRQKSLCLVPERLAIALADDGWIVRSRIAWCKAAPMPESVRDRPTSAWEHVFMLTKGPKYFWDTEAAKQPASENTLAAHANRDPRAYAAHYPLGSIPPGHPTENNPNQHHRGLTINGHRPGIETANLRNFWLLPPDPYPGAHFATFPREIPKRCIAAATSEYGACAACGAPWKRVVERTQDAVPTTYAARIASGFVRHHENGAAIGNVSNPQRPPHDSKGSVTTTTGWTASCRCGPSAGIRPCVVLDPFSGSATTPFVAASMGRIGIGVELSEAYIKQAQSGRLAQGFLPLAPAAPEQPAGLFDGMPA